MQEGVIEKEPVNAQEEIYYEKIDCDEGYIEDASLIEMEKIRRFKDVLYNDMLGDFNEKGEYILPDEIMQDLIDMPKKIDLINDNGIQARGFLGDRTFYFTITPPVLEENGNAYCFLELQEKMFKMGGCYYDTHSVIVATYDFKYDKLYDQYMREVFHLKEYDDDTTGEEGRTFFADNIDLRLQKLFLMREEGEPLFERLEEIYFNHRIKLLGLSPETALIMAEFIAKRNKLEQFLSITNRKYYMLNQILDDVLEQPNCKECLEKSSVKEKMDLLDKKFVSKSVEIQEKIENSKAIEDLKAKKGFANFVENGTSVSKPTPKSMPKGVSKGSGGKPAKKKGKGKGKAKGGGKGKGGDKKKPAGKAFIPAGKKEKDDFIGLQHIGNLGNTDNNGPRGSEGGEKKDKDELIFMKY